MSVYQPIPGVGRVVAVAGPRPEENPREESCKRCLNSASREPTFKGSDGGLPDSKAPQCERTLYNVIGFQPPEDSGGAVTSPVGDDASRLSAIPISEGFNLGYCRAKPGKGPMKHNHAPWG